jgi:hypothetical protein
MGNRFVFLLESSDKGGAVFGPPAYALDGVQVPLLGREAAAHATVAEWEAKIAIEKRRARPHPVAVQNARLNPFSFVTAQAIAFENSVNTIFITWVRALAAEHNIVLCCKCSNPGCYRDPQTRSKFETELQCYEHRHDL